MYREDQMINDNLTSNLRGLHCVYEHPKAPLSIRIAMKMSYATLPL